MDLIPGQDMKRLQNRISELQKENKILRAASSKSAVDFCSNILQFIRSLHCNPYLSDLLLITPEKSLPGHTFVLDARRGLWNLVNDSDQKTINFDASQSVCEALIFWLYSDEIRSTDDPEFLSELLILASEHGLTDLISQCESFLMLLLNRNTCVHLYSVAHQAKAKSLLSHAAEYLSLIWSSLSPSELECFTAEVLLSILERQTCFPLHVAIDFQRADVALLLLETKPVETRKLINSLNDSGLSPLYLALEHDLSDLATDLLRNGADPNLSIGSEGERQAMAHYAVAHGKLTTVEFLIDHGYKINSRMMPSDDSLLHLLVKYTSDESETIVYLRVTRLILNHRDFLPQQDINGNTVLHTAILHRNAKIFSLFMEQPELFDLNLVNYAGIPPIWYALCADYKSTFSESSHQLAQTGPQLPGATNFTEQLIKAGADINFRFLRSDISSSSSGVNNPANGDTLLMACARCHLQAGGLFLLEQQCVANVESTCVPGETAFHLAVESRLNDLARCLATTCKSDPNKVRSKAITVQNLPVIETVRSPPTPRQSTPVLPKVPVSKSTNPFDSDDESACDDFVPGADAQRMDPEGQQGNDEDISYPDAGTVTHIIQKATPLHLALSHELPELVELYLNLEGGTEPDWFILDHQGDSVFSLSLWSHRFDLAGRILVAADRQYQKRPNLSEASDPSEVLNALGLWDTLWQGPTLLHRAVERGDLEAVRFLLRNGVNVNRSLPDTKPLNSPGSSSTLVCPLWSALKMHRLDIASLLVSHRAHVDLPSRFEKSKVTVTLLHRAIFEKNDEAALFLIRNSCDVNICPESNESASPDAPDLFQPHHQWAPLHMAASLDSPQIVLTLLDANRLDVNRKDADGNTALHLAVLAGNNTVVSHLLNHSTLDCGVKNNAGHTAFHVAMAHRNVLAAQLLLKRDRNLALQTDNVGRNFLHIALENHDRDAVFFLIQTGMDMNQCVHDSSRHTPLHLAIKAGVPEDVFLSLILAGANISTRTVQKYTPLHLCVLYNRPELLNSLIEKEADVNAQDAELNTPLHLAVRKGNIPCLGILLSVQQTDCTVVNIRGQQPIHLLAGHEAVIAVEMLHHLLEVRPDLPIDAKDALGNSPLLLAFQNGNGPLCIALHRAGASLGFSNSDGQTIFKLSRGGSWSPFPDHILAQILGSITHEPHWEDGSNCSDCEAKFSIKCRKHHCRHCGRVLCTQCSTWELPIIKFGIQKPVRVCEICFSYLNNPLGY